MFFFLNLLMVSTVNHKILAVGYGMIALTLGMSGWALSIIMRLELSRPAQTIIAHESTEIYNFFITIHALTMIFFTVMPMLYGAAGNMITPLAVGSAEVGFPRINNISLMILVISYFIVAQAAVMEFSNGLGWVMYPPLSTAMLSLSSNSLNGLAVGLLVNGLSSTLTSVNFGSVVLLTKMVGGQINLYALSILVVAFLLVAVLPVLTGALVLLLTDSMMNTSFFDAEYGGEAVTYQHLFWIFGHPEVYVLIVPAFAIISIGVSTYTSKHVFGTVGMVGSIGSIATLGFVVWAHHMFTTGLAMDTMAYFSAATLGISIPSGLKLIHWLASLLASN